jgi:integral membrane protein (TIGR01906 family)
MVLPRPTLKCSNGMKKTAHRYYIPLVFFSAVLLAATVCFPLACAATRALPMERAFYDYADTAASGVTQASYNALSEGITGYLSGRTETAQVTVMRHDVPGSAFSEYELAHLKDVRGLVHAAVIVSKALGACLTAGVIIILFRRVSHKPLFGQADTGRVCKSVIAGFLLLAAAEAAAVIWAAIDFYGLFFLFHRLSFSNSLWLLDPAADLLIQLMPLAFFKRYASVVLLEWIAVDLTLILPAALCVMRKKHGL